MTENLTFDQLPEAVHQLCKKLDEIEMLLLQAKEQPYEPIPKPLTVQQAAEFLTLSVPTIYSMASKGELPLMKRGKRLYFTKSELMDYLKEGRKKTQP